MYVFLIEGQVWHDIAVKVVSQFLYIRGHTRLTVDAVHYTVFLQKLRAGFDHQRNCEKGIGGGGQNNNMRRELIQEALSKESKTTFGRFLALDRRYFNADKCELTKSTIRNNQAEQDGCQTCL